MISNKEAILLRILTLLAIALAAAAPYIIQTYYIDIISLVFIAAVLAASVNMLAGQVGLVSVGHAGIAASASYAVGWASVQGSGYLAQVFLAVLLTIVVSVTYAVISMRTNGIFFLMITVALGMIVFGLAYKLSGLTGGENGLVGISRPDVIKQSWQFYYLCLIVLLLVIGALEVLRSSPFGLVLRGIRDSESRMTSLGYTPQTYKFFAIAISGLVAGLAGVLSVWHTEFVSPASASFLRSAFIVLMVILGGVGTPIGPLVGAFIVVGAEEVLSTYLERWTTVLGLIFIIVILFAPQGIVGAVRDQLAKRQRLRRNTTQRTSPEMKENEATRKISSKSPGYLE